MIGPTNKPNEISTGETLRKVSAILLLVGWLVSLGMNVLFVLRLHSVWEGDRPLVYFGLAAEPFLLVRLIYLIVICFATNSKTFNPFSPNIWVQAFMQVLMEFIVFILFITAGMITPSVKNTSGTSGRLLGRRQLPRQGQSTYERDTELGTLPARR
jgi:hypothetical protein